MASEVVSEQSIKLRHYRYTGELLSLFLTFLLLSGLYALAAIFFPESWTTTIKALLITLAGLAVYVFSVKLQQRAAFGTLVRVSPRQFPELYDLASVAAERLSSPPVAVYVKRASEMNIYTLGLWQRPIIVLTSSLVDQMGPDNLQFFIGREIGHIQAGHTWLRTLLKPLGADVPVIGKLLNSVIFGDWINRTEFTADRAGFIACRSLTTAVSTMLKFGIGVRLYEKLDIREFLEQINEVRNVSGHLTEIMAEMPYLTQRIRSLVRFALSERYQPFASEKRGQTKILKAIPEAFVSSKLRLDELDLPSQTNHASGQSELTEDEQVTVADLTLDDLDIVNAFDPRKMLVRVSDSAEFQLRSLLTRIGRNQDNDIVLNHDRVSRYHAEILCEDQTLKIVDKGSRNGVWVNGQRVKDSTELKSGDKLRIGKQEFQLIVRENGETQ
ncbi:MAG: FHA domain-containing protein [Acidobacteria bacterium]|nr:FHA domain-containing protein [Acidobacteriota bacterium]